MKINIHWKNRVWEAGLLDTPTAQKIENALPLKGVAYTWGDEIYFNIPVLSSLEENAREEVEEGDLAYWPQGPCVCIFFGKTPASTGSKPRAYSPVNVFGSIKGELSGLRDIKSGEVVEVKKA